MRKLNIEKTACWSVTGGFFFAFFRVNILLKGGMIMEAVIILGAYFVIMMIASYCLTQRESSLKGFIVGNRQMGTVKSAMSIAATWIWAPALFVSAEKAYSNGWPGLFWFLVPNILCLLAFVPFARRIRQQMPEGMTLAGYMAEQYQSQTVKKVYIGQLGLLAILSTAVQLLAGGKILAGMLGVGFVPTMVILAGIAYSYSQFSGIQASVITDAVQMILILAACALLVPWALSMDGGIQNMLAGLSGISGDYSSLISESGIALFFGFGLPAALGLMAGPFGDQCFWQRAFSIKESKIKKSFVLGTVFFAAVPLSMGILGFIAAGSGLVADKSIINYELVAQLFPAWVTVPFLFMIISGLLSTIDSNLCAIASLVPELKSDTKLKHIKIAMAVLLVCGIIIADIPGITVTHLFLVYGTLRSTTMLPTIFTLLGKKLSQKGICYGILFAMIVGLPVFAAGTILNDSLYKTIGCIFATSMGVIVAAVWRCFAHE